MRLAPLALAIAKATTQCVWLAFPQLPASSDAQTLLFFAKVDHRNHYLPRMAWLILAIILFQYGGSKHKLEALADRFKFEQYLGFIRNRKLRESIICQNGTGISCPCSGTKLNNVYISAEFTSKREYLLEDDITINAFSTSKAEKSRLLMFLQWKHCDFQIETGPNKLKSQSWQKKYRSKLILI